jgi:hypothetical protein
MGGASSGFGITFLVFWAVPRPRERYALHGTWALRFGLHPRSVRHPAKHGWAWTQPPTSGWPSSSLPRVKVMSEKRVETLHGEKRGAFLR